MSIEALSIGSDNRPLILFDGELPQWKERFLDFIDQQDLGVEIHDSLTNSPTLTKKK